MNKNILYLFLVLVLAGLTYYFVFREEGQAYGRQEANFHVERLEDIEKVIMSNLNGQRVKLSKVDGQWMANDSMETIQSRVDDLLDALVRQRPLQPVPISSHDQAIRELNSNNVKVEVFDKKGITNTFYVGKKAAPNNMTYMLTEGAKRPYIVKIPVHNYFLGVRYSAKIDEWRTRKIMIADADEIERIEVNYADSTHYSFQLVQKPGATPVVTGNSIIQQPLNIKRVNSYLNMWDSIYCYGFEPRNKLTDTIPTKGKRLATVRLIKHNQKHYKLDIYFKPITKGTKGILNVGNQSFDFDVFIGFLNDVDMVTLPRSFTQIMLRSYPEFFEQDEPVVSNPQK